MPYEIFTNLLQPLCNKLETVGDFNTIVPVKEITNSENLLIDTKRVIEWLYQKNYPIEYIIQAYRAADFLEMLLAIRRGFVNYLYDKGVADSVVDGNDLAFNRSGLLISNREIRKDIELSTSNDFCDRTANFENEQIRFFDVDHFCTWVNDLKQPTDTSFLKKKVSIANSPVFFDFSNNKIQSIDFFALVNCLCNNKNFQYSVFNFRSNSSLSDQTKNYIKRASKNNSDKLKESSTLKNKTREINYKKLKLFWSTILSGAGLFGISFFPYLSYIGRKLPRSNFSLPNTFLGVGVSAAAIIIGIKGMRSGWKNLNKKRAERETIFKKRDDLILIDDAFYVLYDE